MTHQDWLEGLADDHLQRERRPLWEFKHGDGWLHMRLQQFGERVASFSMDYDIAILFANAILSEVEGALRDSETDPCPVGVDQGADPW